MDASGAPQNNPINVFLDEETGNIVVGGHALGTTRKFRNVRANAQVALVIDDLVSTDPWTRRLTLRDAGRRTGQPPFSAI